MHEVIEEDTNSSGTLLPFHSYAAEKSEPQKRKADKENLSPAKKAKKCLETKWSTPGDIQLGD